MLLTDFQRIFGGLIYCHEESRFPITIRLVNLSAVIEKKL